MPNPVWRTASKVTGALLRRPSLTVGAAVAVLAVGAASVALRERARTAGVEWDLGTIEAGKLADLTFTAGNPLENIKDDANVRAVMKDGCMYPVEELLAPFTQPANAAAAAAPPIARNRAAAPISNPDKAKYWWHDLSEWNGDECGKR